MTSQLKVSIWRGGADGAFAAFDVPRRDSQTVLDVVTWVQRHLEPALAYRFACRVGMCGSCAMTVNGTARWTCRTHVEKVARDGHVTIAPLKNLAIIKDLVCDMSEFFDKWQRARGYFVPTRTRHDDTETIAPDTPERQTVDAAIDCINCAACHGACDTVAWNPDYLGPAQLNRAWTLINDERDGARAERLKAVSGSGGCLVCHSHQSCQAVCPQNLNPARSIAGLKRATVAAYLKGPPR